DYPCGLRIIFPVKEQQLYTRGVPRVDAEVDASRDYGGAKRRPSADPIHTSRRTSARRHSFVDGFVDRRQTHDLFPAQQLLRHRNHTVRLEAKFLLQFLERSRGPEGLHPDHAARRADESLPPERGGLLNCNTSLYGRWQDAILILLGLIIKNFPRRHRDHTRA